MTRLILTVVLGAALAAGCSSDKKGGEPSSKGSAPKGLAMSSDSTACKKAMSCCEARVKAEHGSVTPENLNLTCSGVAMARTDADCDAFRQGYAAAFTAKGTAVPAECN